MRKLHGIKIAVSIKLWTGTQPNVTVYVLSRSACAKYQILTFWLFK